MVKLGCKMLGLYNHSSLQVKIFTCLAQSAFKPLAGNFYQKTCIQQHLVILSNIFAKQRNTYRLGSIATLYSKVPFCSKNDILQKSFCSVSQAGEGYKGAIISKLSFLDPFSTPVKCWAKTFMVNSIVCEMDFLKQEVVLAQNQGYFPYFPKEVLSSKFLSWWRLFGKLMLH